MDGLISSFHSRQTCKIIQRLCRNDW